MKYNLTLSQINDLCEGKSIVYEGKTISLGETPKVTGEKTGKKLVTDLGTRECIHCETEEEANRICKLMHEAGLRWINGDSYLSVNRWNIEKNGTCYWPKDGMYASRSHAKKNGYIIYPSTDF